MKTCFHDCHEVAEVLIPAIRYAARAYGYAIGVHGSLRRDIDLIAAPWAINACEPKRLAEVVQAVAKAVCGIADIHATKCSEEGHPGEKPWGRLCWCIHLGGGPYIDLSVMPMIVTPPAPETPDAA